MISNINTSVALCTYNGEKFLAEQLESILAQQFPVDEIVVCDDASTDRTAEILHEYQKRFPNIFRVFINEENLGYVLNFEKALSLCSENIVFLCDQDDIWFENKVSEVLHYFSQHPEIGTVAHDLNLTDIDEEKTFWQLKNFVKNGNHSQQLLLNILENGNIFPGMSIAIRKKHLEQYIPFQKVDSIIIHDYEIIIKALRDDKFGVLNSVLATYRQHGSQAIGYRKHVKKASNEVTEIHLMNQNLLRIRNYVSVFNLNKDIEIYFQKKTQEKYRLYLNQFPHLKRFMVHLRNKYYYKIIHY